MTTPNQNPLAGALAKQKCMGYALVDIIVKVYSHSSMAIIADKPVKSQYAVQRGRSNSCLLFTKLRF